VVLWRQCTTDLPLDGLQGGPLLASVERTPTDEQTTDNQLTMPRKMAQRRGWTIVNEYVLTESAWNGNHRAQLAEAMQAVRLGEYDVLLVWALYRLSREGVEPTLALLRKFRQHGVSVISLQAPWTDTGDPHLSELRSSIFAWMAHAESERHSERTTAGLARRKAEGKPIGRLQGAKDRTPRRRSGYVKRWENERNAHRPRAEQDTRFSH
jgi:DNA invertase Pin-like site-specific DNA recombinase